ncbi:hypothetical protein GHT06_019066 [Daphnia sinensis]|uniref:Uncharacterized protein n=1 Tax=Daphnia sinensis TaxID=1820382 RepID=A0AAD5PR13_9CRUS|nr:hypothetical protein GHT06_019066 [Daphnia sinensis]
MAEADADYDGDRPEPAAGQYEEDETDEQGRSWRPKGSEGRPPGETDGIVAEVLPPLGENAQDATLLPAPVVSKAQCQEIALLLSAGVSTDQSKLLSKEFPLAFEEENFTLKPPKLDGWVIIVIMGSIFSRRPAAEVEAEVATDVASPEKGLNLAKRNGDPVNNRVSDGKQE